MFALARSVDIVATTDIKWVIPTRVVMALLLAFPIGGGPHVFAWCDGDAPKTIFGSFLVASCTIYRGVELLTAIAFLFGFLLRIMALPALVLFGLRAISNVGNSIFPENGTLLSFIQLDGDYAFGAAYIAAVALTYDLICLGSGGWSIDLWLSRKFASSENARD